MNGQRLSNLANFFQRAALGILYDLSGLLVKQVGVLVEYLQEVDIAVEVAHVVNDWDVFDDLFVGLCGLACG